MARAISTDGADEFLALLNSLADKAPGTARRCVYDGMRVLADEIFQAIDNLPVDSGRFVKDKDPLRVITQRDRRDLAECLGIGEFSAFSEAIITASVSVDGYISRKEENYPNGVPAALILRSIESGSSVRAKHPVIRPATNRAKDKVLAAMSESLAESIRHTEEQQEG